LVLLAAQPYRLTLRFNTGEVRAVDLEAFLRAKAGAPGSAYRSLLDPHLLPGAAGRGIPNRLLGWVGP